MPATSQLLRLKHGAPSKHDHTNVITLCPWHVEELNFGAVVMVIFPF